MKPSKSFLLFTLSILLLGCSRQQNAQLCPPQELKISFYEPPSSLDPRKSSDLISSSFIYMLYEGLTKPTPASTYDYALAKSINISPDQKTYTFYLKEAYWSNGDPITAYDFEASWKSLLHPLFPGPNVHMFYPIKNAIMVKLGLVSSDQLGVHALNANTLQVELEEPTPFFLDMVSFCCYFPVHSSLLNTTTYSYSDLIISGPFTIYEWKTNNSIQLKKNEEYHSRATVRLDNIQISFIQNDMVALNLFEQNELDIVGLPFSQIPAASIASVKDQMHQIPIASSVSCSFNTQKFPFTNKKLRKALALAINRKNIIEHATQLGETVATQIVPPILKGGNNLSYFKDGDIKSAFILLNQALDELGMTKEDLSSTTLSYFNGWNNKTIAQIIQHQWREALGINIQLVESDAKICMDQLINGNYDIGLHLIVCQYHDTMDILARFERKNNPKNYPNWEYEKYKHFLKRAAENRDPSLRDFYMNEAEQILIDEVPLTSIYHCNYHFLKKDKVKNYFVSPIGSVHFDSIFIDYSLE